MDSIVSNGTLSAGTLMGFAGRVGTYDRDNRFFPEDFEDLRRSGYLTINVPKELGGQGFTLAEVCREQRRLAYHAPATALGINMHLYWIGIAADLWRAGDRSLEWILKEAMAGEIFAAGHAERGNDLPVLLSTAKAEKVEGGFRFTGHKMFGSLAPVWTRYGLHGLWADARAGRRSCTASCRATAQGYRIVETWDTMGMRATRSDDVVLDGAFVPDKYMARILPAGGADRLRRWRSSPGRCWASATSTAAWPSARCDLAIAAVKGKTRSRSAAAWPTTRRSSTASPRWSWRSIRSGRISTQVARDWSSGVDHGADWPARSCRPSTMPSRPAGRSSTWRWRCRAAPACSAPTSWSGCSATPAAAASIRPMRCWSHEIVAKTALGIDLGEQPRWG